MFLLKIRNNTNNSDSDGRYKYASQVTLDMNVFADMLARLSKGKEEREEDAGFFTDDDGDDGDEDKSIDDYSDARDSVAPGEDKGEVPAPAENARDKRVVIGSKSVAQRSEMALKRRAGETSKGDPPEFDPCRVELPWGNSPSVT